MLYNACDTLPDDLQSIGLINDEVTPPFREQVQREAESLYPDDLVRQVMYSDQHTFLCSVLDRNDRMTMGASIECRVPFLDYRLVEGLAALPTSLLLGGSGTKPLLRRSLGDRLPTAVLRHPKWGFGVPWKRYLRDVPELRNTVEKLPSSALLLDAPFDRDRLKEQVRLFLRGDDSCFALILELLMTSEAWNAVQRTTSRARIGAPAIKVLTGAAPILLF